MNAVVGTKYYNNRQVPYSGAHATFLRLDWIEEENSDEG